MANYRFSVYICAHTMKRYAEIMKAVESILKQTYTNYELIVVIDNNAELYDKLKSELPAQVKLMLNNQIKGVSATRNLGVESSRGDIIASIDDDGVATEDWLERLAENYKEPDVVGVGGRVIPIWNEIRPDWFAEELDWIVCCTFKGYPSQRCQVRNFIGCNMSFRREVFDRVGGFTTKLGKYGKTSVVGEEVELSIRIARELPNTKMIYDPGAMVFHNVASERKTLKYLWSRSYNEGVTKAMIDWVSGIKHKSVISSFETGYLKLLVIKSIPGYIFAALRFKEPIPNLKRAMAILIAICATVMGFLITKMKYGEERR